MLRSVRDRLKRFEGFLYFVTAVLGVYLAGANLLRSAKWPHEVTWTPWSGWFIAMLVAAVYVPL